MDIIHLAHSICALLMSYLKLKYTVPCGHLISATTARSCTGKVWKKLSALSFSCCFEKIAVREHAFVQAQRNHNVQHIYRDICTLKTASSRTALGCFVVIYEMQWRRIRIDVFQQSISTPVSVLLRHRHSYVGRIGPSSRRTCFRQASVDCR